MWTAIDGNHGYVKTVEEVEAVRKNFELTTSLRLVSLRRTANFGNNIGIIIYYNSLKETVIIIGCFSIG